MKGIAKRFGRLALGLAAGMAASLSMAGEARAEFTGPGVYVIKIWGTNQVLDVDSGFGFGGRRGQALLRWGWNDGSNQKFLVMADGDGYVIRPLHSLQCLDVPGYQTWVGQQIVQWPCGPGGVAGGPNERFHITLNSTTTRIRTVLAPRILYARYEGSRVELIEATSILPGTLFEFVRI